MTRSDELTTFWWRHARRAVTAVAIASSTVACGAGADSPDVSQEAEAFSVQLKAAPTVAELTESLRIASEESDDGVLLQAETFTFDRRALTDEQVMKALLGKLRYAKLRSNQGSIDRSALDTTLEEYGVSNGDHRDAIALAIKRAVGENVTTRKLWLRSDDVPDADSEWSEVVVSYVAKDRGVAVRLVIRSEM